MAAGREVERPEAGNLAVLGWASDAAAEMLRRLGIDYVALVPGSSYRGLHDSLVNYLGNARPRMLVCLHEEHAVAIAHGFAKVTERPMAAAVHANVGLMHAAMAVFNAWCDRAPILLLGATGPVDATRRRPWIDWIHTAKDQGALIRDYVKWDAQPASAQALVDDLARAAKLAAEEPRAPVYVCLDVGLQETALAEPPRFPDPARRRPAPASAPNGAALAAAADLLRGAARPVLLAGRVSRDAADWRRRVALAEGLGARVLTDMKCAAAFPARHPLHPLPPVFFPDQPAKALIRDSDVILALDWLDLGGTLGQAFGGSPVAATVISASLDERLANGWSLDHQAAADVDVELGCTPDAAVAALCEQLGLVDPAPALPAPEVTPPAPGPIDLTALARAFVRAVEGREVSCLRLPLGWPGRYFPVAGPLDYLGYDGGAGLGSGPGMAVGSALALRGSGRLPVAVLGDGDLLMGAQALWTAAHYRIPLLIAVANNRSYFNDEMHQERVARQRGRPPANRWIGQRLDQPPVDIPALARSLGLEAPARVERAEALVPAIAAALDRVAQGATVLLDAAIDPGYASEM
jgi:thiamine pyrophosphate-dependent acetolactate synthase large subunit-like protein